MKKIPFMLACFVMAVGLATAGQALGAEESLQLLFVQNAKGAVLGKGRLVLKEVSPTTIYFSDRPKRIAGHMETADFVLDWQEGKGKGSFAEDPPNGALSILGKDTIVDVVVELKNPRLVGTDLVYDIKVLEKDIAIPSGPCSLFIDPLGRPASPTSVAGVRRRERRRHEVLQ